MKENSDRPANTGNAQSFKPQFVIDFILEIARQLKTSGLAEIDAICIARDAIELFEKENRGTSFYFKRNSQSKTEKRFIAILEGQLVSRGLTTFRAKKVAATACERVFFKHGGETYYLPTGKFEGIDARNAEIVAGYLKKPGYRTVKSLAVRFKLSQTRVYEIIRAAGKTQSGVGRRKKAVAKDEDLQTT